MIASQEFTRLFHLCGEALPDEANRFTNATKLAEETGELAGCVFRDRVDLGENADVILCAIMDAVLCGATPSELYGAVHRKLTRQLERNGSGGSGQ